MRASAAQGHEVIALSRNGQHVEGATSAFSWAFTRPIPEQACQSTECAIHLAHDFAGEAGAQRTIESTLSIVTQLRQQGVPKQLFVSSYSAGKHAESLYGETKLSIERALAKQRDVVIIRPGLVLGAGGIYGRIRDWAQSYPVIPLPDGGYGKVPVIEIETLCQNILRIAADPAPKHEENIFHRDLKSLRQLVMEAADDVGRRPWILPIPSWPMLGVLMFAQWLRIPLPANADNLKGFLRNQKALHQSTIQEDD